MTKHNRILRGVLTTSRRQLSELYNSIIFRVTAGFYHLAIRNLFFLSNLVLIDGGILADTYW